MFYIQKTIEDADDFIKYIRDDKGMQDQIKEWSDEDLDEMYYYFQEMSEYDTNCIDEIEIWDILRFNFCIYKGAERVDDFLDLSDFLLDMGDEINKTTTNFSPEKFLTDIDYRIDVVSGLYSCYCMVSKSGDIIVSRD